MLATCTLCARCGLMQCSKKVERHGEFGVTSQFVIEDQAARGPVCSGSGASFSTFRPDVCSNPESVETGERLKRSGRAIFDQVLGSKQVAHHHHFTFATCL
jgi:hypothetical protein